MERVIPERFARYTILTLWALLILSSVLWVLVGSVSYWVRTGWLPADSAGWAQAIGAFVAIVVAVALPYFQSRQQQIQRDSFEQRERLDGLNATSALAAHMHDLYKRLAVYARPLFTTSGAELVKEDSDSLLHELVQAAAMLREIPVVAISNQMVHFLIGLREVANYGEFVSEVIGNRRLDSRQSIHVHNKVLANLELIAKWLEELDSLEADLRSRCR